MDVAPRSPNAGVRAATAFTWFPLYDRNPQRFVPNVFAPKPEDFRAQVHRVRYTARYPSHVSIGVIP